MKKGRTDMDSKDIKLGQNVVVEFRGVVGYVSADGQIAEVDLTADHWSGWRIDNIPVEYVHKAEEPRED